MLAIAGFAAFGTPDDSAQENVTESAAESMGHTAGAYAGLSFALAGEEQTVAVVVADTDSAAETATREAESSGDEEAASDEASSGTIASPTSGWLSEVEVRSLIEGYFQPTDVNRAVRIAWCESRFDPDDVDARTGAVGLFNHLPRYWEERSANAGFDGVAATDPEASTAAAAWEVYDGAGWDIFTCR